MNVIDPEMIQVTQLARLLCTSYNTVHDWCANNSIPSFRTPTPTGRGGKIYMRYADVRRFLVKFKYPAEVISRLDQRMQDNKKCSKLRELTYEYLEKMKKVISE